jgi:hypothetical protein
MDDRWVPKDNAETPLWGVGENLYAVLGPHLSQLLIEAVETSVKPASQEIREVTSALKEVVGRPPAALFHIGATIAGLEAALRRPHREDGVAGENDDVLNRLGWEAYKHVGSSYVYMFERFGFTPETLRHYMENCAGFAEGFDWPPPGVAYQPVQSKEGKG